jgi:hypothetical protein
MNINTHFIRENKILLWLFVAPFVIGAIVTILYSYFSVATVVDTCLDSGGSFNYEACNCDYKNTHDFKESHSCE